MSVQRVRRKPNGELVEEEDSHVVLVYFDNDKRLIVFDGNYENSHPFEYWYGLYTGEYIAGIDEISGEVKNEDLTIEIFTASVALIPVPDDMLSFIPTVAI